MPKNGIESIIMGTLSLSSRIHTHKHYHNPFDEIFTCSCIVSEESHFNFLIFPSFEKLRPYSKILRKQTDITVVRKLPWIHFMKETLILF